MILLCAKLQKDLVITLIYFYFASKTNGMEKQLCLICIGSNTDIPQNMELARKALTTFFPDISFGKEQETAPLLFHTNLSPFHNQPARFYSLLEPNKIKCILKEIENCAGRMPEDKSREIVKLDIDLIQYGNIIFKPDDLKREYIKF